MKSGQNCLCKNLQKTNPYRPVPKSAKQSVITTLFDQANNVVSNENDKIEEIQKNSSKEQLKSTTGEKNSQDSTHKKNLSKPKTV